jgi:hypothetical protein
MYDDRSPAVEITHHGCRLVIQFAGEDDVAGDGPLARVEILPAGKQLELSDVRQLIPRAAEYVSYARAAMQTLGPPEAGTIEERWARFARAAEPLRRVSGKRRGLSDGFYQDIAEEYRKLTSAGERHPVKALSEIHHADISSASRWVRGARERGFLQGKDAE